MVYVFLAEGFEEIEAVTVIDVLRRSGTKVLSVGIGGKNIKGSRGITVCADIDDSSAALDEKLEMIYLPGGMNGMLNLDASAFVEKAIRYCQDNDLYISAMCAAPAVLGHKGVLKGKKACCYPGMEKELLGAEISADDVTVDGKIITSKGPATAMALAVKLAEIMTDKATADKVSEGLLCK